MLRSVTAIRYVTPLREGGSLPGLVEADDLGTYVAKFVGAGQGRKALIAEIVAGELARRLGFRVPELVLLDIDPALGRVEPDQEVQDLLNASPGLNLGVDFLPRSLGFEPLAWPPDEQFASRLVWFDAFVSNVDRSWRNPNLLVWHRNVWLIDHGATLVFAHSWRSAATAPMRVYDASDHVLAPFATAIRTADAHLAPRITAPLLDEVLALVPDPWLADEPGFATPADVRAAYAHVLLQRAGASAAWLPGRAA